MPDDCFFSWPSDWAQLTPGQQNALMRSLASQADTARARAIGQALLSLAPMLWGWPRRAQLAPASARNRRPGCH